MIQMARVMACELAQKNIRVNSLSPGFIETPYVLVVFHRNNRLDAQVCSMTKAVFSVQPEFQSIWSEQSFMNRLGKPHELRGIMTWLASDASSFCTGSKCVEPVRDHDVRVEH